MYFNALDFCDGFWVNNGRCIVYPQMHALKSRDLESSRLFAVYIFKTPEQYKPADPIPGHASELVLR